MCARARTQDALAASTPITCMFNHTLTMPQGCDGLCCCVAYVQSRQNQPTRWHEVGTYACLGGHTHSTVVPSTNLLVQIGWRRIWEASVRLGPGNCAESCTAVRCLGTRFDAVRAAPSPSALQIVAARSGTTVCAAVHPGRHLQQMVAAASCEPSPCHA
jgi:hypothetical protein